MLLAAGIILLLILLTALYVAAEFAAVGARRSRLRRLAEDGNPLAARILPVIEDPRALDRYIAASQVGITLSSLILGAYAQAILAPRAAPLPSSGGRWIRRRRCGRQPSFSWSR
jgi:CBS domain containing-hemolysin-like protein